MLYFVFFFTTKNIIKQEYNTIHLNTIKNKTKENKKRFGLILQSLCAHLDNTHRLQTLLNTLLSTVQDGSRPLHVASTKGYTEVVDILLKSGADPNLASATV